MARPIKQGVDYFPLDCHMNDAMKLIQAEFGLVGYAVVIKLWQKIYSGKGYYTEWGRDVALVFADNNRVGANVVQEVVRICLKRGIFDQRMFDEYGILTSDGIQERFAEATTRRTFVEADRRYLLIPAPFNWVFDSNNPINVDNNSVNVDNNSQRKENKSKENSFTHSIARERENDVVENSGEDIRLRYLGGKLGGGVVMLSDEQFTALCEELSSEELDKYIAIVRDCELAGKHYKNKTHYQAILDMVKKDRNVKKN